MTKVRQRLARDQEGFTLIELLVVIIILAILVAIAVPSYLGFRARANENAAKSNVRAIVPAIEAFYSDKGVYTGMSRTSLKTGYDQAISTKGTAQAGATAGKYWTTVPSATTYCVSSTVGSETWRKNGPGGEIEKASC